MYQLDFSEKLQMELQVLLHLRVQMLGRRQELELPLWFTFPLCWAFPVAWLRGSYPE